MTWPSPISEGSIGSVKYSIWGSRLDSVYFRLLAEAKFLDVIGTKVLSVFLFTVTSANRFNPPPLPEQKWITTGLVCKGNIVYEFTSSLRTPKEMVHEKSVLGGFHYPDLYM
jgi:hypothetical protein